MNNPLGPTPMWGPYYWPMGVPSQLGWTYPKCSSVYGPMVTECWRCNKSSAPTIACGGTPA